MELSNLPNKESKSHICLAKLKEEWINTVTLSAERQKTKGVQNSSHRTDKYIIEMKTTEVQWQTG